MNKRLFLADNERGAVLVTGLVLLLVITLFGITAMQSTTLEEKMAANYGNRNLAMQSAEAAVRQAEAVLSLPALPATKGIYATTVDLNNLKWDATDSDAYTEDVATLGNVAAVPRYVIEELGDVADTSSSMVSGSAVPTDTMYRVTARGVGGDSRAVVVLQSTFRR